MGLNLDADIWNADWTKQKWDMPTVKTVEQLRKMLKAQGMSVAAFKKLPVYQHNVTKPGMEWLKDL